MNKEKTIGLCSCTSSSSCFSSRNERIEPECPSPVRTLHAAPGGHPGPAAEAGRASHPQVSQQKPGKHGGHQAHLQPHHQAQHCAGALGGHRSVSASRLAFVFTHTHTHVVHLEPLSLSLSSARQQVLLRPLHVRKRTPDLRADGPHGLGSDDVRPTNPSELFTVSEVVKTLQPPMKSVVRAPGGSVSSPREQMP